MLFIFTLVVQLVLGIVPGFLLLVSSGISASLSFCLSIPISLSVYSVLGTVFSMLGMYGSAPILAGTALAVALITIGNFAKNNTRNINMIKSCHRANSLNNQSKRVHSKPIHLPIATLALSVSFALFIFFNTYYLTIGSMDSFVQYDDNATHLAMIESESQLGNYSTLKPAYNLPNDPNAISETAYYPSGFHTIPALSCTLTGANAAISENASAILYTCIAFPLGITSLVYLSSGKNSLAAAATIPMSLASVAFPLRMLTVHAPFPNIAGFSLIPQFCIAFILTFDLHEPSRRKFMVPLALIMLSVGFVHPNALIFGCVYVFPYFLLNYIPQLIKLVSARRTIEHPIVLRTILQLASIAFACLLWLILNKSSFMKDVVTFLWAWSESLPNALADIASGALLLGKAQYAFGLLTIVGAIACCTNKKTAWQTLSYAIISVIYLGTAIGEDTLKSLLAGFWYTDPERLAAMLAITMIPLASFGLYCTARALLTILDKFQHKLMKQQTCYRRSKAISIVLIILIFIFAFINFRPLVGNSDMKATTAWAQNYYDLRNSTIQEQPNPYTHSERLFVKRVSDYIGNDLILNHPYDGSTFAYSVDGLNAYYPYRPSQNDSDTSKAIRTNLKNYTTDPNVQNAIRAIGAKWVLILDKSEFQPSADGKAYVSPNLSYAIDDWKGFENIGSDTPGFELVLQEGSCSLYRISSN